MPPYGEALGIEAGRDADGRLVLTLPFGEHVRGRPGFLHGGAIAGLLEIAAFATLREALGEERDVAIKPITVTADFMRGGHERPTFAAATVTRLGRRIANVEGFAWQEDEARPIAAARLNMLLERR
ncbi:MAG: PaaI family thioesterase [Sphingomonadaceae bacterium]|nr:PaaI family thioesterase [Sphingomonadaceae bacterium]